MSDIWSAWIQGGRDDHDPIIRERSLARIAPIRDRVLQAAAIHAGDTVLDIGCGDGLLGLAALSQVGDSGTVMFSDISQPLLDEVAAIAKRAGADHNAKYVCTTAEALDGIDDASVDIVVLRAVLIYVTERDKAIAAIHRVLRPGGRLSLYEPLVVDPPDASDGARFLGFDTTEVAAAARAVQAVFDRHQPPNDPMLTLSATELRTHCETTGLAPVTTTETVETSTLPPADDATVQAILHGRGNPRVPSIADATRQVLEPDAAAAFLAVLERQARKGGTPARTGHIYLAATKPDH